MQTPLDLAAALARPVLNLEVLEGLQSLQERRGNNLLDRLFDAFEEQSRRRIAELRSACDKEDLAMASGSAHALKGSCQSLGLERMAEICGGIEIAARTGDVAWCEDWLPALDQQVLLSREQFAKFLGR